MWEPVNNKTSKKTLQGLKHNFWKTQLLTWNHFGVLGLGDITLISTVGPKSAGNLKDPKLTLLSKEIINNPVLHFVPP